jgi:hypothetical protein
MKHRADDTTPIPICSGGTVPSGITSIPFTNSSTTTAYTITSCVDSQGKTMPGWPATDPVIPIAAGGINGSHTVDLASSTISGKSYTYTPSPACPIATPPKIIVS